MLTKNELFHAQLKVVNVGLESFYGAMLDQNPPACHIDWKPPAGGDPRLLEILAKLSR